MDYTEFLRSKIITCHTVGKAITDNAIHPLLFPFQRDLVRWACAKGRCAIFADTGLGKTFMQLEWARLIGERTLIIAPLTVARQTVREAVKIDISMHYTRSGDDLADGINITNYELIEKFDASDFGAVVLDESSILKSLSGQTRKKLTRMFAKTPYRLCCTATPAPNDYTELGNHVEFLGICKAAEMLAMFFINANKEHTIYRNGTAYWKKGSNKGGQEWRLKHHAEEPFFRWLSSWAAALIKPSDLGYDDDGFILPPLNIHPEVVRADYRPDDQLFFTHIKGIKHAADIRRQTIGQRLEILRTLVNGSDDQWIVWVGLNDEGRAVTEAIPGSIEVRGEQSPEYKSDTFEAFQDGRYRVLVTKPRIGGFGMNFQNAHKMAFFGLNYSWEMFYQAIRREWRYMQPSPVDVYIIMSDVEQSIYRDVMRKDAQARRLREGLIEQVREYERGEIKMQQPTERMEYETDQATGEAWATLLGDSCERLRGLEDDSIDLSVYSPPFADLFIYTDSNRDLGNCRGWEEFFSHYRFIIREMLRVTKAGRLTCVHSSDIPALAQKDGYIGVKDFPGEVIRAYESEGWVFVGRAFVDKNPQAQAIRTHSQALLFVQMRKDSASSRPALIDQILLFRKPGENAVPIMPVENGELDNELWINWAHGIWTGISETDTLQYSSAREADDEKHICPLQLGTIERCIKLWSNPGELVCSPFMGIGSEGYQAIKFGRRFIGIELKRSYWERAVQNLREIEAETKVPTLFEFAGVGGP